MVEEGRKLRRNPDKKGHREVTTICRKCSHVRQAHETNPEWQCPGCGVCYAKVVFAAAQSPVPVAQQRAGDPPSDWSIPWGKLILITVVGWGIWTGFQTVRNRLGGTGSASVVAELSPAALTALAATVKPDEVVMYSTTECVYCAQAKGWLSQNGFAFTECNMSVSRDCERQFMSYGATGTPFLLVRGHQMKDGFDSDEFLAVLQREKLTDIGKQ
jgi:glutaredoxin